MSNWGGPWSSLLRRLVIPSDAGPGDARIVIGGDLPPPLDTYVPTQFIGATGLAGAILFYSEGNDTTYGFIAVVEDDPVSDIAATIQGSVVNGVIEEVSAGNAKGLVVHTTSGTNIQARGDYVQLLADALGIDLMATGTANVTVQTDKGGRLLMSGTTVELAATGSTIVDLLLRSLAGDVTITATDDITIDAASDVIIDGTATVDLRTNGTGSSRVLLDSSGVAITAGGVGDSVTVTALNDITLDAGDRIDLDGPGGVHLPSTTQLDYGGSVSTGATSATSPTTTSTSYVLTANVVGVAFVAPPNGKVMIHYGAAIANTLAAGVGYYTPEVRDGTVVGAGAVFAGCPAADSRAIQVRNTDAYAMGRSCLVTGLTAGANYNVSMWHKSSAAANTAAYAQRDVYVTPAL